MCGGGAPAGTAVAILVIAGYSIAVWIPELLLLRLAVHSSSDLRCVGWGQGGVGAAGGAAVRGAAGGSSVRRQQREGRRAAARSLGKCWHLADSRAPTAAQPHRVLVCVTGLGRGRGMRCAPD